MEPLSRRSWLGAAGALAALTAAGDRRRGTRAPGRAPRTLRTQGASGSPLRAIALA